MAPLLESVSCLSVKFGFFLPQGAPADLRSDVALVAREAEQLGYSSLWVYEKVLFPVEPADGMYGIRGLRWLDDYRFNADPLTVLTLAAAATETVRLGTSVLVAPFHPTHWLARAVATLDQASGGRVVLGLGSGWSTDEFLAMGADFATRGAALEESIDGCRALWQPNPLSYQDSRMSIQNALVTPKPAGTIPIMLGGGTTKVATDRIGRKADGWMPAGLPAEAMREQWAYIRQIAARHGRDTAAMELVPLVKVVSTESGRGAGRMLFQGSLSQIVADVADYADAGADEAMIAVAGAGTGKEYVARAEQLMTAFTDAGLCAH